MNILRSNKTVSNSSNYCFSLVVTVIFIIVFFEVMPERTIWTIPVKQAEEHIIAIPALGEFPFLLTQKREAYKTPTKAKERQQFWKRILIVDDEEDITITFKAGIEDNDNNYANKRIEVHTSNNPVVALTEFKPNFYDLLLVDINMPHMNRFELSEKILAIDINVQVCFMSSAEINREALREIYPLLSLGCFIKKPVSIDYLVRRIMSELN